MSNIFIVVVVVFFWKRRAKFGFVITHKKKNQNSNVSEQTHSTHNRDSVCECVIHMWGQTVSIN